MSVYEYVKMPVHMCVSVSMNMSLCGHMCANVHVSVLCVCKCNYMFTYVYSLLSRCWAYGSLLSVREGLVLEPSYFFLATQRFPSWH